MRVLFLSSEVAPFAKTGGLGDVAAALPRALHRRGHDVRLFMPLYSRIDQKKHHFTRVDALRGLRVKLGHREFDVSVLTSPLPNSGMDTYFVHCPALYGRHGLYTSDGDEHLRFLVLQYAALEACQRLRFAPDVVHSNDWQTAWVPLLLKTRFSWDQHIFARAKTVLTIHNLNYQGTFSSGIVPDTGMADSQHLFHQDQLREGRLNSLLHGIMYADAITTVSPTYAKEIRTTEYGAGLDGFLRARGSAVSGILNGVDYGEWSPAADTHILHRYTPSDFTGKERNKQALLSRLRMPSAPGVPLFGIVSRLAGQKGFDLFDSVMPELLHRHRFQLIVQGSGERRLERMFRQFQAMFPQQVRLITAFDNTLAHWIQAGSDFLLVPSRYEPCGLTQMYAMKYGTVPVVRKTGGLADTVDLWNPQTRRGTGVVFDSYDGQAVRWAVLSSLELYRDRGTFRQLQLNGMAEDFSWDHQVRQYEQLYSRL
ncbi:MAG: glycogen synthase [Archangium sp.]|nr:glycogen synthase [Archangium sp.]